LLNRKLQLRLDDGATCVCRDASSSNAHLMLTAATDIDTIHLYAYVRLLIVVCVPVLPLVLHYQHESRFINIFSQRD
jgi:hypothetical protein